MKFFLDLSIFRRNRNFALLFFGQFISFFGTMMTSSVALNYQIYHETQSTLWVGLLSLAQLIPLLFTALMGGVLADRYHRRQLLLLAETFMAVGCLILAWNATLTHAHIGLIFLVASGMSALVGLHRPAFDSITQQIVEKKDFPVIGALSSFKFSVAMIAGPAVGGLIVAHYGVAVTYCMDFLTFALSLVALLAMKHIPKPTGSKEESVWQSFKVGFQYAFARQHLVGTYVVDFIAMVFGMPNALFPAIAQQYGGVKVLGLLYAAPAIGSLLISFLMGWASHIKRHGVAIAVAATLWGITIIGFGMVHYLPLALLFLALAGAFDAVSGVFRSVMWNETIPNHLRGRLAGIELISYLSGPRLGDAEAGFVAAAFGVSFSVISGGVLCVAGVAVCCYFLPKFWQYQAEK